MSLKYEWQSDLGVVIGPEMRMTLYHSKPLGSFVLQLQAQEGHY